MRQTEGEYDWTPESEIQVGRQATSHLPEPLKGHAMTGFSLAKTLSSTGKIFSALKPTQRHWQISRTASRP